MREFAPTCSDIHSPRVELSSEDQQYIAELRKFFELVVRDLFLVMAEYGKEIVDKEYVRLVISRTRNDEEFLAGIIRDAMREVIKRDLSHLPMPVTIYRDDEVVAMIRNEASILVSAFRKIKEIELEEAYTEGRQM